MVLFYVLSFFKKGDTIQGGILFKEIRYFILIHPCVFLPKHYLAIEGSYRGRDSPVKFVFSKMATKINEIFTIDLTLHNVK